MAVDTIAITQPVPRKFEKPLASRNPAEDTTISIRVRRDVLEAFDRISNEAGYETRATAIEDMMIDAIKWRTKDANGFRTRKYKRYAELINLVTVRS